MTELLGLAERATLGAGAKWIVSLEPTTEFGFSVLQSVSEADLLDQLREDGYIDEVNKLMDGSVRAVRVRSRA